MNRVIPRFDALNDWGRGSPTLPPSTRAVQEARQRLQQKLVEPVKGLSEADGHEVMSALENAIICHWDLPFGMRSYEDAVQLRGVALLKALMKLPKSVALKAIDLAIAPDSGFGRVPTPQQLFACVMTDWQALNASYCRDQLERHIAELALKRANRCAQDTGPHAQNTLTASRAQAI